MGEIVERAIVIADSDPDFRRAAVAALRVTGLRIREATSGEEVLDAAEEGEPALLILDVRLEGISAYEVCRRLRDEHGDRLPIIFVSLDRTEPFDRVAGFIAGADDYLAKPVDLDELTARVRRHLARTGSARPDLGFRLTGREREVLGLLARGLGPVDIGTELTISPKTVATHIEHIYVKLGVHTRAQAVASAFRLELVDFPAATLPR